MALVKSFTAAEVPFRIALPAGYIVIESAVVKVREGLFDLSVAWYGSREIYEEGGGPWERRTISGSGFNGRAPLPAATMMYSWLAHHLGGGEDDGL